MHVSIDDIPERVAQMEDDQVLTHMKTEYPT
jgi:hypothetical protein